MNMWHYMFVYIYMRLYENDAVFSFIRVHLLRHTIANTGIEYDTKKQNQNTRHTAREENTKSTSNRIHTHTLSRVGIYIEFCI